MRLLIKCDAECKKNDGGYCQAEEVKIVTEDEYEYPVCRSRVRPPSPPTHLDVDAVKQTIRGQLAAHQSGALFVDHETLGVHFSGDACPACGKPMTKIHRGFNGPVVGAKCSACGRTEGEQA